MDMSLYIEDMKKVADIQYRWEMFQNSTIAISGGTGMIGSFLVDLFMYKNENDGLNINIIVLGRNREKAEKRFARYVGNDNFHFACLDINERIDLREAGCPQNSIDYIIHAASNTHPVAYASDPIGTITANVTGTKNMLDLACDTGCRRFVFLSSVEVYGENKGDTDKFAEDYMGYIDCNTLRAGYPESKRCGEALCQAYKEQKKLDIVIPRLSRTYGPTMLAGDTKAISQFILKGVAGEDIILKSEGTQLYSYTYVADAASAIIKLIADGENGQAYNVVSDNSDITLKELAGMIADYTGRRVVFELPEKSECAGYSKATKATLDSGKLKVLGWNSMYNIETGIKRTIDILKER